MIYKLGILIPFVSFAMAGCDNSSSKYGYDMVAPGKIIAKVNGQSISQGSVEFLANAVKARRGGKPVTVESILDEVINRELLRQELEASDAMKDESFMAKLENSQRMMLSQSAVDRFLDNVKVDEPELKKEYSEYIEKHREIEYHAKHILLDSEEQAGDALASIKKGTSFSELASKLSKDVGTKVKGGDLGWFNAQKMAKPFADAVAGLKNGGVTDKPVKTQFGWHLILREDSREKSPPTFEAMKDRLSNLIRNKKLQEHLKMLRDKAKIATYVDAKSKDNH